MFAISSNTLHQAIIPKNISNQRGSILCDLKINKCEISISVFIKHSSILV